jgi:hypothetical protein
MRTKNPSKRDVLAGHSLPMRNPLERTVLLFLLMMVTRPSTWVWFATFVAVCALWVVWIYDVNHRQNVSLDDLVHKNDSNEG